MAEKTFTTPAIEELCTDTEERFCASNEVSGPEPDSGRTETITFIGYTKGQGLHIFPFLAF